MAPPSSLDYAGDISATEAWERLKADPKAQLVDVRTMAEWNFVGLPDLSALGRQVHCIEWQSFPTGARNPGFVAEAGQALARQGRAGAAAVPLGRALPRRRHRADRGRLRPGLQYRGRL